MKRPDCLSAMSRRHSETDIRKRLRRNSAPRLIHNQHGPKNPAKVVPDLQQESMALIKAKLNNFINCGANQLISNKTCSNLMKKKNTKTAISQRKSLLKIPAEEIDVSQQALGRWSRKIVKVIWSPNDSQLQPVVISGDFLADQDVFWEKPVIPIYSVKPYKWLHKCYYVVWMLRSQRILPKLK